MTLDPVHFQGIADLARRIRHYVDIDDGRDLASDAWENFFDPLYGDGRIVLEPIDRLRRRYVPVEEIALQDDPFPTRHGLDSGTINPRTFKNGLVLDVAQAAMSACPSDLELHRSRTLVATVHSNDRSASFSDDDWHRFDEGYSRGRVIDAPRVEQYEKAVVHALSLYLAESSHALEYADAVEDLLVLDGPLYPKGMVNWLDRHSELAMLLEQGDAAREVVENYVELVERFVDRGVPLVGFVKNVSSKGIIQALDSAGLPTPWANDAALFARLLERRERVGGSYERVTDELTATNWFVSRTGPDRVFAAENDELELDRELAPEAYEVTFFVVYDPRTDIAYKIEAPYAFTRDAELRGRLTRQLLTTVAVRSGPPYSIQKADELARIGTAERDSLIETIERAFETSRDRTYDEARWGREYSSAF